MIGWKCGVFLVALCQPLYAELLVVKKDAAGMIAALDNADEARYLAAMNILMKYQWPMCTISQLTEDEQKELLSPGVPAAEENFIRKKIKALDQNLDVVFVPTTIYELFCLRTSLESAGWLKMAEDINFNEANPKKEFVTAFDQMNLLQQVLMYASKEDADEIDRPYEEAAQKTMHDVYAVYGRENDRYLNFNFANISPAFSKLLPQSTSLYFYINRALMTHILSLMKSTFKDGIELTGALEKQTDMIAAALIADIGQRGNTGFNTLDYKTLAQNELSGKTLAATSVVKKVIDQEYKCRSMNKAFILRGTGGIELYITLSGEPSEEKGLLLDNPFYVIPSPKQKDITNKDIFQAYKKGIFKALSLSFGNSLFAGCNFDKGACAYFYLSDPDSLGYGLMIDKQEYIKTRCNKLFFVSPLSTLAGFFGRGEFFHSRTTVVMPQGNSKIKGLCHPLKDNVGFLTIKRDPLCHAWTFAKYVASNAFILQIPQKRVAEMKLKEKTGVSEMQLAQTIILQAHNALVPIQQAMLFAKALQEQPNVILKKKAEAAREKLKKEAEKKKKEALPNSTPASS